MVAVYQTVEEIVLATLTSFLYLLLIFYPLQLPTTPTMDDFRILSRHLRSDSSGSSVIITDEDGMPVQPRPRTRSLR